MDQALVGVTIQVVLQNLLPVSLEEIKHTFGFKKDLNKLRKSLIMIQDLLAHAEANQVGDGVAKHWLEQLEDVTFKADAVLDEFNYELLRNKVKKQNGETNKVINFLPSVSCKLPFSIKMARKVKDLNNELEAINNEATCLGLQTAVTGASHSSISRFSKPLESQTNSFSEPDDRGRKDNVKKDDVRKDDVCTIVNMLVDASREASREKIVYAIPILGMGGIGKTTVARKVFHDGNLDHLHKIWVCVSFNFDAMDIFKMILENLTGQSAHGYRSEDVVLGMIKTSLKHSRKRYLLVLDDVWNDNRAVWDAFMSSLKGMSYGKGNCIIVTTRSQNVASNVGMISTYPLRKLSDDECWLIIEAKASSSVKNTADFQMIGRCIAQKCAGLPLAAKLVGALLCVTPQDKWITALENKLSNFGQNDQTITKILKLSYDRLPSSLHKKCFAYCSVFPQDFKIKRIQLIELWMAEGFLRTEREKDMESLGDEIFNFLLQNCLFQDAEEDKYGIITECRMHDLVHDLACSVSGFRTIRTEEGETDVEHQARYLSIKFVSEDAYGTLLKEQVKYLRTIFIEGNITDSLFRDLKRLHVLKLTGDDIKKLPDLIGGLIHLRFLDIWATGIKCLPNSIGKLKNLQTLRISPYRFATLKYLPKTVVDMISLRHLHAYGAELPPEMGKLTSLQTLQCYSVGDKQGCKIGELGKLKNLKGSLEIRNLEKVKDKKEAEEADLSGKANISGLIFEWNQSAEIDTGVLDGLQPHVNLKSLEIKGFCGEKFPQWTIEMAVHNNSEGLAEALHNLIEIRLFNCKRCEEVPILGHLRRLRLFELSGLPKLKSIGLSFYGHGNVNPQEPVTVFPALEKLKVWHMPELTEWAAVEGAIIAFPCLKYFEIVNCPKLNSIPNHFACLELLTINSCPKLKSVSSHLPCAP